nr:hypothetical protein [Tanacetum cinerariifolium]
MKTINSLSSILSSSHLVKKVIDDVELRALIDGKKVVVLEAIIRSDLHLDDVDGCLSAKRTAWNEFSYSMASTIICLATVVLDHQVDDMTTHNTKYTSPALTQKLFANMRRVGKGFSCVKTPLFASMLVQPQPQAEEGVEIPITPAPPSTTSAPSPTDLQDPTPKPHATPLQEKDKHSQALEILQLQKRVKKLENKKKSKSSGLRRLRRVGIAQRAESYIDTVLGAQDDASKQGGIATIDADEGITLVDVETDEEVVAMDAECQEWLNQEDVNASSKGVSAVSAPELVSVVELTIFDDEVVTMTMAQTLIKLKAEKAKLLDEQIVQKLHDEEYANKEENIDWSAIAEQVQERCLDSIRKYQNLKKKPVSIAQARKNMIIYLKNMAGYKMEYFRGITYDKVAELEKDKHSQALEILQLKKRVKKLENKKKSKSSGLRRLRRVGIAQRAESYIDTVLGAQEDASKQGGIATIDADEDMLKGFDREDLVALWNLVKEKFSLAVPSEDKEKALWVEMKRLFEPVLLLNKYKMEYFKRMTYDKVRRIFKREYKKVQTLFKPDKDVQEPKNKRVGDETLLQESFKKLRAAEVSGSESTQEMPFNDPKEMNGEDVQNMLEIVPVLEFKVEALQVKYPIIDWEIHNEEKFSSAMPSEDKEKALWVELKRLFEPDADDVLWKLQRYMHGPLTWRLYIDCEVHYVSSTRGHDIFMLTEKKYPLSNAVMILMLSGKLQVKEDNEMARDLVMKIFMEANKPKSKIKEKFSSAMPSEDKEKALWVELKRLFEPDADDVLWKLQRYMHGPLTWRLYIDCELHHVSSTRGHDIFMLTEKEYPLSNAVMILMLSGKLQVKEDNEMARDLVMKIFMVANKPKSKNLKKMHKGITTVGLSITTAGSTLALLDKVGGAAEVLKNLL